MDMCSRIDRAKPSYTFAPCRPTLLNLDCRNAFKGTRFPTPFSAMKSSHGGLKSLTLEEAIVVSREIG